jgi:hypothetical protein
MRIHIITKSSEKLSRVYIMGVLADVWVEQGHTVTTGPIPMMDADIAILHIDATVVSDNVLPSNPSKRLIINSNILDISKSRISSNILNPLSDYDGQVIVKTDANHYGRPEFFKLPFWHIKRLRRKLTSQIHWSIARELPECCYPICQKIADVPSWVWRRQDLIVEPFQPEVENGEYVVRVWIFFGKNEYCVKLYSSDPIVKSGNSSHFEFVDDIPESIRSKRTELGIEFGKIDFTIVNGQAVLLDVNKTPTVRFGIPPSQKMLGLAEALDQFIVSSGESLTQSQIM